MESATAVGHDRATTPEEGRAAVRKAAAEAIS